MARIATTLVFSSFRDMKDLVVKNSTKNHTPLKPFSVGDLCYRRHFYGKRTVRVESLCEVIEISRSGETYHIRDLERFNNTEEAFLKSSLTQEEF